MIAIVGATGKVGYSTSLALRKAGVPVRAIVRDAAKAARLVEIGCEIAVADVQDAGALAKAIADVDAVQIILAPSPQAKDAVGQMRSAIESLAVAIERARCKRVLAISDYGAHIAEDIGMPTMFRSFEARLGRLDGHKLILRSAEHMQNWGRAIPAALASGTVPSFVDPVDRVLPTISAFDLGAIAAELLLRPARGNALEIVHAEGPRRYSAKDVANALSELLGRKIDAQAVPRARWQELLRGMSVSLAELLIKANDAHNRGGLVDVEPNAGEVRHGSTVLIDALRPLAQPQ